MQPVANIVLKERKENMSDQTTIQDVISSCDDTCQKPVYASCFYIPQLDVADSKFQFLTEATHDISTGCTERRKRRNFFAQLIGFLVTLQDILFTPQDEGNPRTQNSGASSATVLHISSASFIRPILWNPGALQSEKRN